MAMVCSMPLPARGANTFSQSTSTRAIVVRRDLPLSALPNSQSFTPEAKSLRGHDVCFGDSDDDIYRPPKLSELGRSVLDRRGGGDTPIVQKTASIQQATEVHSPRHRLAKSTTTPAPSLRIKRVGLQGAPVRRARRTPQSEEQHGEPGALERQPEPGQENVPLSIGIRSAAEHKAKHQHLDSITRFKRTPRPVQAQAATEQNEAYGARAQAIGISEQTSVPSPPKMSILETATKAAGASTTKKRTGRAKLVINGNTYMRMERCGKGGSADVHRVQAENGRVFALKRVRLAGADPTVVTGYMGEIELLQKLQHQRRIVHLYDNMRDDEKHYLYLLMELGEGDLDKVLSSKLNHLSEGPSPSDNPDNTLDFTFVRYWWKEMLCCVLAVHDQDIVHSDLKPANFLVVKGALKLIDFGIAGKIDIENTINMQRDNYAGTPNYISPESLQDSRMGSAGQPRPESGRTGTDKLMKLGKPSDVWSLGCILYQMVYGTTPFGHITPYMAKFFAIMNPAVSISFPLTGLGGARIPHEVRRTLKNCLQRDPSKRPTVRTLVDEYDTWVHPENAADLSIPQHLLDQIIWRLAERFRDKTKTPPTDEEVNQYAPSFYAKIREWEDT